MLTTLVTHRFNVCYILLAFVLKMDDMIIFWTKTSGITGNSKLHLSKDGGNPFCGVDTYYFEFGGDVIDITKKSIATSYTKGTSVYQEKAYLNIPSDGVCKKCLKRALANEI